MKLPHREFSVQRALKKFAMAYSCAASLTCSSALFAQDDAAIHSKSSKFRIPFEFDAAELSRLGATEIQLFVSSDQGKTWKLQDAVDTDKSSFVFRAESDSEYWFSVRTVAAGGLTYPSGPHDPGLKVVVDTTSPEVDLDVRESKAGEYELNWRIDDRHVEPNTMTVETRNPDSQAWEKLSIKNSAKGTHLWKAKTSGPVEIRMTVADKAGNSQSVQKQIVAAAVAPPSNDPFAQPSVIAEKSGASEKSDSNLAVAANKPILKEDVPTPSRHQQDVLPEPIEKKTSKTVSAEKIDTPESLAWAKLPPKTSTPQAIEKPATPPESKTEVVAQKEQPRTAPSPTIRQTLPKVSSTHDKEIVPATIQRIRPEGSHLVNSATFRVGYSLHDVGQAGVESVELYITENAGEQWFHYGSDADNVSPFDVKVPRDGQYGFVFRVRSNGRLTSPPPQPGEQPEVVVVVDRTAPIAKLTEVRRHPNPEGGQVSIQWQAADEELSPKAVKLYSAPDPTGPWTLIAEPKEAAGQFNWAPTQQTEKSLFVRLEVRDAAGNVTVVDRSEATGEPLKPGPRFSDTQSETSSTRR